MRTCHRQDRDEENNKKWHATRGNKSLASHVGVSTHIYICVPQLNTQPATMPLEAVLLPALVDQSTTEMFAGGVAFLQTLNQIGNMYESTTVQCVSVNSTQRRARVCEC